MRRLRIAERPDWRRRVEAQGLLFHPGYWSEGTFYELAGDEIGAIERATGEIHAMCLEAVGHVIRARRYPELGVPAAAVPLIERAWELEPPSLYGRLDLALGPDRVPKLLEYNADTPTSLLEAAVIQWTWLEDVFPARDQFNALHDALIDAWKDLTPHLGSPVVHFGCVESVEDEMTVGYLRDTAEQAGLATVGLTLEDIGWQARGPASNTDGRFVDRQTRPIRTLFKLYPWEGLLTDPFGKHIPDVPALNWIEPVWKMVLSSKGILPILWELFPGHPNLLPASFQPLGGAWVKKPMHGREGCNVTISAGDVCVSTGGPYDGEGYVYQAYADLGSHDGARPVIGSWLIGGEPRGLGIRESQSHVTDNTACFVPHVIG
jgi:glutathionylspermidine synthase